MEEIYLSSSEHEVSNHECKTLAKLKAMEIQNWNKESLGQHTTNVKTSTKSLVS
jgi:hypothetical protein